MLYLKKINFEDVEEEYKAIKSMPAQENGFENKYHDVTNEEFINEVIPKLLKNSEGLDLPDGYVPDTYFFLLDDDKIVGLFKIRHYLNDFLRKGAGHIGYGILPEYRGKGYAKKGLVLAIEKCKEIIKENEIYLSVHKDNPASLRVQLGCGAFIVGETEEEYLTRIKLKYNNITFGFRDLRRDDWKRITEKEVIVEDEKAAEAAIQEGKYVACKSFMVACKTPSIQAVVDATGSIPIGAEIALNSILNKKHIVMLNAETDCVVGPILKKLADDAGVIFTGSAGDEPGAVMGLYDFATSMGFDVRVVGKGKNNKLDYDCNPDTVAEEAARRGAAPHMITSFKEGTKTMVEMALMCNATGFVPDVRGGHGIEANVKEVPQKYSLKEEGGVLNNYGVVDFVNGIAPGVFVVVTHKLKEVRDEMEYLSMGPGPNYILYRPYHLCSLETPLSAAMAVIEGKGTIVPKGGLVADVITVAKKDLKAGEYMDGYGAYTCYGLIEKYETAKEMNAVPIGLVDRKTKVLKDIKKGEVITYDMVEIDKSTKLYHLRQLQEQLQAEGFWDAK